MKIRIERRFCMRNAGFRTVSSEVFYADERGYISDEAIFVPTNLVNSRVLVEILP